MIWWSTPLLHTLGDKNMLKWRTKKNGATALNKLVTVGES